MIYINSKIFSDKITATDFIAIDIREQYELEICSLDVQHIPMGSLIEQIDIIDRSKSICLICRTGKRAEAVADLLETEHGFTGVYVLEGGIIAYANEVDQTLEIY